MKLHTALLALAACGLSTAALAEVKVELPYSSELVLVNGKEATGNETLTLHNGEHQIAFRYQDNYRENGDYKLYKSEVIIIKFAGQDTTYQLALPKLRTAREVSRFDNTPTLNLTDPQAQSVSFAQDKLVKHGMQFGRDYEKEIQAYNLTNAPAALASLAVTPAPQLVAAPTTANTATPEKGQNVAENMLFYWYEQADAATRERFKAQINQQAPTQ
ncbi:DUF2057 domain-containing protein [Photobacterium sp. TY1-4]|uniref:YccT family protein n=1 Tax=Photobacterium sp. TY1-4 TaxID=2899122 RepID=UPI0021BFDB19|nr:DUF2057 domain-containing protein [Photobacterium sp. TY1-4]UXI02474.1 DUF2057 domain-containing protein [Photobacterium sp. TY1-4]